ncbi:MAG: glycosyltransferase family 2 protein [Candidatus Eiseniibacteriota bacterium]
MDLSLILVYYKAREHLRACLPSLPAACAGLSYEVIVVDNASADGVAAEMRREFPHVRWIENSENVGFARGVNRGLAVAGGRAIALLNPDTIVEPGAFSTLVRHLDQHPATGAVGPKILDPDGSIQLSCRRFPTHWTGLFNRYSLLTRLFPNNPWSRAYLMLDFDHASTRAVDWISGACLVTRRDVVERVGPMDEAFFLFNEDVDWCRRMHDAGYDVVYLPEARCMHAIGASKGAIPLWLIWRRHQGMRHYFRKHHKGPWPVMLLTDLGILLRCAAQVALNPLRALGGPA